MDTQSPSSWARAPAEAFVDWQRTEAAGADRRPFSKRSIIQHAAMFDRFQRHLTSQRVTVATFGPDHLEMFFADVENRCAPGTTTGLRYAKLIDRLCRHLVSLELRTSNPATQFVLAAWPDDEPVPVFLDQQADLKLQAYVQPIPVDSDRDSRNRAIVALLAGTGISAAEIRTASVEHLDVDALRPHIYVPKHGARDDRKVTLSAFAVPALAEWKEARRAAGPHPWLFPSPRGPKPITDMQLGRIVREALEAIEFHAPDMSPRVLRNTYARRQLIAGRTNEDVSRLLGLASQRTVTRLRSTLGADGSESTSS